MPNPGDPTLIRVATYNLYLGADLALLFGATDAASLTERVAEVRAQLAATSFEERAVAIARILAREQPDVIGLQEVARWTTALLGPDGSRGAETVHADFLPTLVAALAEAGCRYDAYAPNLNFSGGLALGDGTWMGVSGANVTLVRHDARLKVTAERTGEFARTHDVVTAMPGVAFPVARSWGAVEVELHGRRLLVVNTHTEAYDKTTRDAQRDELLAVLDDVAMPVVLVGDLNATPDEVGVPAPYVDAWTAATDGAGLTCGQRGDLANPESLLHGRIDYVFVRDARVLACRTVGDRPEDRAAGGLWPSDHAGVVADLDL
jgi:endonuclease/exonuclease/phosphatase family metal-dependent hydrolase